jgi:hypothetical protein
MPGEEDMRREFVKSLDEKLGQLVTLIFTRMKLAGDVGSLLKIEKEMTLAIREIFGEHGRIFKESDEKRWMKAEGDFLKALQEYSERAENGRGFSRRLFAEDAERGVAFVDLCRRKYDVVLMNPPFGKIIPKEKCKVYLKQAFPGNWTDYFNAFLIRARELGSGNSLVGAVIPDRILNAKKSSSLRELFLKDWCPLTMVDCGREVMDEAAVDALFLVTPGGECGNRRLTYFFDLKETESAVRSTKLRQWATSPSGIRDLRLFGCIPGVPFAFNKPDSIINLWKHLNRLDPDLATVATGGKTFDDERFLRLRWEVVPSTLGIYWLSVDTGGDYQPWISPSPFVQDWREDGRYVREFAIKRHGTDAQVMQSSKFWFKSGLSYPLTSSIGFGPRIFPKGTILSADSIAVVPKNDDEALPLLGLLASSWAGELLTVFGEYRRSENSSVKALPVSLSSHLAQTICPLAEKAIGLVMELEKGSEISSYFVKPFKGNEVSTSRNSLEDLMDELDEKCKEGFLIRDSYVPGIRHGSFVRAYADDPSPREVHFSWLSYAVGTSLGRWNVRIALDLPPVIELPDPFDSLPTCPPGMLQGPEGLPAKLGDVPSDYPVRIDWDGIMVDDVENQDDIVRRVQEVLEVIWEERAEAIEQKACEILAVRELRDYFRKPGNGGFWMDHVKRYSKSRRKAPIYWYLRSAKGNYGLWLYYHRLDKDILFKALLNYVEPKIRLEEDRLKTLRGQKEAAGSSGRGAKQLERDLDRQDQFISELHDFKDKLRRAADLHLTPDLNDGVVLNITPLWELVPWKEAQKYWDELLEGKHEWSSIGRQLREKGIVR